MFSYLHGVGCLAAEQGCAHPVLPHPACYLRTDMTRCRATEQPLHRALSLEGSQRSPGLHHRPHDAHGLHQLALARLRLWRDKHVGPQLGGGLEGGR